MVSCIRNRLTGSADERKASQYNMIYESSIMAKQIGNMAFQSNICFHLTSHSSNQRVIDELINLKTDSRQLQYSHSRNWRCILYLFS